MSGSTNDVVFVPHLLVTYCGCRGVELCEPCFRALMAERRKLREKEARGSGEQSR